MRQLLTALLALSIPLTFALPAQAQDPAEASANTAPAEAAAEDNKDQEIEALQEDLKALREELDSFKAQVAAEKKQRSIEELRRRADSEANSAADADEDEDLKNKKFRFKGLGLQRLNPEISIVVDTLLQGKYIDADPETDASRDHFDANLRSLNIHFQTYLDPYTKIFAAFPVMPTGAVLGEAYLTRFGFAEGLTITLGRFRQWFAEVNRWHKPALDQTDFPLALTKIFGGGGLVGNGVGLEYHIGGASTAHALYFQLTEASNGVLFGNNTHGMPSALLRYLFYMDISDSAYFELGATGFAGLNDRWSVACPEGSESATCYEDDMLYTGVYAAEAHFLWEPTDRMRHRNLEWRGEFYFLDRQVHPAAEGGDDRVQAWGLYTYLQSKVVRTLDLGLRFDWYQPEVTDSPTAFAPHAVYGDFDSAYEYVISPYLTWYQSPFVHTRLQFDAHNSENLSDPEYIISLQVTVAGGPHLHERY